MPAFLQNRILVIAGGALCLLALGIAAERTRPYPDLAEVLSNPEKFHDRRVALIVECRAVAIIPEGFVLKQGEAVIRAQTSEQNIQLGDYVSVEGILRTPSTLEVTSMHVARNRRAKMAISVFPVILVIFLAFKNIGYDKNGGLLYLRKSYDA